MVNYLIELVDFLIIQTKEYEKSNYLRENVPIWHVTRYTN